MRRHLATLTTAIFCLSAQAADSLSTPPADTISLREVGVTAKSAARRLQEGAFAVSTINITPTLNRSVSLTDLMDRSAGVRVRREGGMGSDFDITINGLSGNSIRYFIDGMPLETKGSGMTTDNIPLNMVERIELYKGVVPARLSADALGGAVNIVTRHSRNNYLDASYGIGSFHTHTADLTAQYFLPHTAVALKPSLGINYSRNNYMMKGVEVWSDAEDRYVNADLPRFHDRYRSVFGQMEAEICDVSWVDRLTASVSYSHVDKQLQTGAMQNKVYGDAERHSRSWTLAARYDKRWEHLSTRLSLSHTTDRSETVDTAYRKYSWDGTWMPASGNELTASSRSIRLYRRPLTVLNAGADYRIGSIHTIALDYMLNRRGNRRSDRVDTSFDPSHDIVAKHIISLSANQSLMDGRWQSTLFVKDYINALSLQQTLLHTTKSYTGAGAGARYAFGEAVAVKASYEHSVRLPLSRELLGNGTTVVPNTGLSPETSNNYNLGTFGSWRIDGNNLLSYEVNGYIRHVLNYIRAVVSERDGLMQYVNTPAIDVKGVDLELNYTWDNRLQLSLNGTWNDARDLRRYKSDGNPSATYRNRVPNRPWLMGNAMAAYTFVHPFAKTDRLRISIDYQYIHRYFLNWEAFGSAASKAIIPSQNLTDISLTYSWHDGRYNIQASCDNLFDRLSYDNYMLQRPGRSFAAKFRIYLH